MPDADAHSAQAAQSAPAPGTNVGTPEDVANGQQLLKVQAAVDGFWEAKAAGGDLTAAYERVVGAIALSPYVAGARTDLPIIADGFISMWHPGS